MRKIRHIYSENPYNKLWDTFVFFESEPTTKKFLADIYHKQKDINSIKYSFQNTSKFIYFLKQAREYFLSAEKSNILVKPLLIYYGMMNLVKAVILTKEPSYPSRTGVLRHGITTRKLKKLNYQFHDDEIKIQKEGLLTLFYTIMTNNQIESIEGNKYKIKELLSLLPELSESYHRLFNERKFFNITIEPLNDSSVLLSIPRDTLIFYEYLPTHLVNELNKYTEGNSNPFYLEKSNDKKSIAIKWIGTINKPLLYANFFDHPMLIQDMKGNYSFRPYSSPASHLPEIMVDYMLMFNLGMLCRYETELWGDIIFSFTSEDMYIINEFINITMRKFPNMILNNLLDEFLIFEGN